MPFSLPALYPILDASLAPVDRREEFLKQLVSGLANAGVTLLQYRNKLGGDAAILSDAAMIKDAGASRLMLIMNDRADLAVRAGFDGVHLGQEDVSPDVARKLVGSNRVIGISTHNHRQLAAAEQMPVDYIAIGPVFSTVSKLNPDPVVGLGGVREARAFTTKPLVAIGGITMENARTVLDAGADSVAVISALFGPGRDSAAIAKDFLYTLQKGSLSNS
jgi:thiamine-phosphate pyrophosphorylase